MTIEVTKIRDEVADLTGYAVLADTQTFTGINTFSQNILATNGIASGNNLFNSSGLNLNATNGSNITFNQSIPYGDGYITSLTGINYGSARWTFDTGSMKFFSAGLNMNSNAITSVSSITSGSATLTGLTTGRIVYPGAGGILLGNSALTWNGSTLSATNFSGTWAGTAIALGSQVSGTLPVANGGTGATTFTSGRLLFGNGTSAVNTDSSIYWDNTNKRLQIGTSNPANASLMVYQNNTNLFDCNNTGGSVFRVVSHGPEFGIQGGYSQFGPTWLNARFTMNMINDSYDLLSLRGYSGGSKAPFLVSTPTTSSGNIFKIDLLIFSGSSEGLTAAYI